MLDTNVVVQKLDLLQPSTGNLRLTRQASEAIGHVGPVPGVGEDIDRFPRSSRPNAGAHQFQPLTGASPPPASK